MLNAPGEVASAIRRGEVRAVARAMRWVDDRDPRADAVLGEVYGDTGGALVVGITGNPGSGKSTLVNGLIHRYRREGRSVGVVAVDPSSPFSGGAILGDRVRMHQHFCDPGVFIRSLATRGHLGGLSASTLDTVALLDAMGRDVILLETVGVGQDEVDIVRAADTTVVVLVPGLGDEIQALKAGILEIADIYCINKADREGADRLERELLMLQALADAPRRPGAGAVAHHGPAGPEAEAAKPPVLARAIVRTVAHLGEGVADLAEAIETHAVARRERGGGERATRRAELHLRGLLEDRLLRRFITPLQASGAYARAVARVAARGSDPYTEVEGLIAASLRSAGAEESAP